MAGPKSQGRGRALRQPSQPMHLPMLPSRAHHVEVNVQAPWGGVTPCTRLRVAKVWLTEANMAEKLGKLSSAVACLEKAGELLPAEQRERVRRRIRSVEQRELSIRDSTAEIGDGAVKHDDDDTSGSDYAEQGVTSCAPATAMASVQPRMQSPPRQTRADHKHWQPSHLPAQSVNVSNSKQARADRSRIANEIKEALNRATKIQLMSLRHVGPKRAEAILAFRKSGGKFSSVADLSFCGFGSKVISKMLSDNDEVAISLGYAAIARPCKK